jgi:hypothetical protein
MHVKRCHGHHSLLPWSSLPASSSGFDGKGLIPPPRAQTVEALPPQLVASSFKETASAAAPLSPTPRAPRHAHALLEPSAAPNGAPGSPASHPPLFNAPGSPLPRSYLDAARFPPLPSPKTPTTPFKTLSIDGCFHCLLFSTKCVPIKIPSATVGVAAPATIHASAPCPSLSPHSLDAPSFQPHRQPPTPLPPHTPPHC